MMGISNKKVEVAEAEAQNETLQLSTVKSYSSHARTEKDKVLMYLPLQNLMQITQRGNKTTDCSNPSTPKDFQTFDRLKQT